MRIGGYPVRYNVGYKWQQISNGAFRVIDADRFRDPFPVNISEFVSYWLKP